MRTHLCLLAKSENFYSAFQTFLWPHNFAHHLFVVIYAGLEPGGPQRCTRVPEIFGGFCY
jgi:hypothetical protein